MPESRKKHELRHRARTHALVGRSAGFRVQDAPVPEQTQIKIDLTLLEEMGMVTFVSGVGWIDSMPALIRYQRKMGLTTLLG